MRAKDLTIPYRDLTILQVFASGLNNSNLWLSPRLSGEAGVPGEADPLIYVIGMEGEAGGAQIKKAVNPRTWQVNLAEMILPDQEKKHYLSNGG